MEGRGWGGTSSIVAGAFQSVEDDGKADLSEVEKVLEAGCRCVGKNAKF